ncbi:MAG: SDR family NAD(P)-dependent oxidoreductase [Deltaproteobacteria bacterium]|nr:MAG: SDR family NAD(P)-dependent oxidoreductase [Deltaproteobacteria bacterium]
MSDRILITGATGNIGSELLRQLQAKGADVVAGTNSRPIPGTESVSIDFADRSSLERAMKGVATVFMVMPAHPEMAQWGENVIDAARNAGVSHVVRSSGSMADEGSSRTLDRLLGLTDAYLAGSGLDYTITAPNFFMQNFATQLSADFKENVIAVPAGDGGVAWIDVRDIAAVSAEVLLNPKEYRGKTLTITGSQPLSYAQAVEAMNRALGTSASYIAVSDEAARKAMTDLGLPEFVIDVMVGLGQCVRQGHVEETTDTVERLLGRPPITFEQFVQDHRTAWI